ncbi:putative RNA recognition motif domain, nucleotide-binding alpha-beta plait domain superfamily [Helianthus annuus]|uniref:RNA recognition motif domain, nucleotide-binding alpha-beta plait domain superfamily n=1 Tax=Helianthus annuus TaxID=4232 RepID=A0A9K3IW36_HELAN|nr:putative RNA recognition motif domain, nucleotide-binding alpha-beta plait domain superfamily [Helianthus annuus]KAJ0583166.1 putative RNA recognition motif domain, nucleotide-binding alpha-beta plait domain superfamily [Helianthus annuus]KAJ0745905.1 putative RNA recognition motif domain, nucleotide-binding alpha-beta plait domain superfamily [Helianthus annuus]KAJ0917282.1 putative RNA recognition motif domain, nucleotide-binding alpha-beta plait domain superfamily [Helianthus annuus]KAJ09
MAGDSTEDWQDVVSRKGRKGSQQGDINSKVITKFFVSNLPPKCSSLDLKEFFGTFGTLEGSYIARKLDRWGKQFAFLSFRDVIDAKRMEGEMGDVWMGSYKLFVVLARFVDGETRYKDKQEPKGKSIMKENATHANPKVGSSTYIPVNSNVSRPSRVDNGGGRTYLDSVLNKNTVEVINVDDNVRGFSEWNGCSLMGKVVDFKALTSLKGCLNSGGWGSVDIKYASGYVVLLVFRSIADCERFYADKGWWSRIFNSLVIWDGSSMVVNERTAWLQVHGIPIHLAIDEVFDLVGARYGEVVQPARMTTSDNNFSYAYIGVLCKSRGRIVDRFDIRWRGCVYNVWIDEDAGEWVPDCVEDFDMGSIDGIENVAGNCVIEKEVKFVVMVMVRIHPRWM